MSSSNLVKWGGGAAMVAGLIFVVFVLLNVQGPATASLLSGPLSAILLIVAVLGQMAGIGGLHALQRGRYGRLGTAGSLLALVGLALPLVAGIVASGLGLAGDTSSVTASLVVALLFLLGLLALFVGLVLLGVATLRARVLPSWFGVLLIVGLIVVAVLVGVQLPPVGVVAYGVFWVLVGYVLLSSRATPVTHPTE